MSQEDHRRADKPGAAKWYELFSRGARDWLRHDEKVREAVTVLEDSYARNPRADLRL